MNMIRKLLAVMMIAALCACGAAMAEESQMITAHDFLGEWVDQNGTANIDIAAREEGDGYVVNVQLDVFEEGFSGYFVWAYGCVYDGEAHALKSFSRVAGTGNFDPDSEEEITEINFEYAGAEFSFNDAGMLIWRDESLEADDDMAFEHTIGWTDPDYIGPGHHYAGEWDSERMTIVIEETMEDYQVAVFGSGSAFDGAYWTYTCDYDAETDTLVSNGGLAAKYAYTFTEAGDYSQELIYEDGEAVFSLNGDGLLTWDDKKENAGEGRLFERFSGEEEAAPAAAQDSGFSISPITDEIFARIYGKSFKEDCTLPREDLRYLKVLYVDLSGEEHEGEMIVNYHIAEDVLDILRQLYEAKYPIERIRLVDEYGADDELSMEDNNSSAFNFRFISHTTRVSKHGLGLAVDINTLYNPYTKIVDGERIIEPITAEAYLDRDADFPYKIDHEDLCYQLFIEHGFEWGGDWEDRKDYQHFEIPTAQIQEWYPDNQ